MSVRHIVLALLLNVALSPLVFAAEPNTLTKAEIADGWLLLFDGHSQFGWTAASKANWKVVDGIISVSEGEAGLLHTTSEFDDYLLKVDFRNPPGTNSGVFLRTVPAPKDPAAECYELNIATEAISPFPTGSFVKRQKATADATAKSDKNALENDATGWHSYEITAQGGHFVVKLDGRQVLDYTDERPVRRGFIGLQLNSGAVEFRNVKLRPLSLKSIFNGQDLTGWRPFPGKKAEFSVTSEKALNVKNGDGQLESVAEYGDFVLQTEVYSNGKHLNSGIFFRCIPGQFWQGYEAQIQNGYKDDDRSQPTDCGTGGFYRRQNARRVVADDFEWFGMTLVATGNHMATWVDGHQVSDWTDNRKPADNPRQGLRLKAGTLAIQAHDKTTDLSFRNIKIAETPQR